MNEKQKEIVRLLSGLIFKSGCAGILECEGNDHSSDLLKEAIMDMVRICVILEIPGFKV